jgi:DNA invertase Pin-like site-specific DNA recombinase
VITSSRPNGPRVGIYLWVSSKRQEVASQEPDLRRWVTAQGEEGVRWFKDSFAGKTLNRRGFDRLFADMRAGKIHTVVVWRLDRLGRTAQGPTELFEEFAARKTTSSR